MLNNIFFQYHKISRMLSILPRKSKSVRLLYFSHTHEEKQVTLKYRFSNAVFYKVGNLQISGKSITLPTPEDRATINFTVYGFFRKNEYVITITPEDAIITRVQNYAVITPEDTMYDNGPLIAS